MKSGKAEKYNFTSGKVFVRKIFQVVDIFTKDNISVPTSEK